MFRRRPRTRLQKVREIIWPSMGWGRLLRYYRHRMGRLQGTPHFIAAGFATGVAVSFTPFIGFHLMTAGIIAWILDGSLVAMVLGTVMAGNPWTFPFIWIGTYKLGVIVLGKHGSRAASSVLHHQFVFSDLLHKPLELLLPMTLGSIPLAVLSWVVSFYLVRQLVKGYKEARLARIHKHYGKNN
ncbi:MAG: DUF2062 domain-containing protein [Proteobacteria bacterium]|nr:DUF2062 domain-containing protein [Pseudomonadota bacterium]